MVCTGRSTRPSRVLTSGRRLSAATCAPALGGWSSAATSGADEVRHVHEIAELKDVAVATRPAYRDAVVEYRSTDPAEGQEDPMSEHALPASEPDTDTDEDRPQPPAGGLQVEDRVTASEPARRGLADEFRSRGFPGETATLPWDEFEARAVTWTGSVDNINSCAARPARSAPTNATRGPRSPGSASTPGSRRST